MSSSYEPHHRNAAGTGFLGRIARLNVSPPNGPRHFRCSDDVSRRDVNSGQADIDSAAFEPKGVDKSAGFIVEKGCRLSTLELRNTSLGVALQRNRLDR